MALIRKYWGFNLYSAVPVPTQSSAVLVEPRGLEPLTFSLQGNCAPNCATAPYQTTVIIEVSVSDLSLIQCSSLDLASRELLCRTPHSYSTAGCEFSLTRYPQRLSSLL